MTGRGTPVPSLVMDRPVLHSLVDRLRADERLPAFAAALPTRARVSEPALPLLLAALYEELGRALVVLLPEDADARDAADAASWFLGEDSVALLPSRGVHWGSGLEPPPHLVGERARALDVLARGGLVCASAAALAERMPPPAARPAPLRIAPGEEPGIELLAESLALAGYERVERVEERGQFAVRGGLVDVFPTTGREPLRIELFGDEIEQIRAFSAFTQRALRAASPRRRTSSARSCGRGSTSSSRSRTAVRRSASRTCSAASRRGCSSPATSRRGSTSPLRPPGAASSGATSGSRSSPTRRSSASGRRARRRRPVARCRASATCAPATTSCTRTTGSRSSSASRRRRSRA